MDDTATHKITVYVDTGYAHGHHTKEWDTGMSREDWERLDIRKQGEIAQEALWQIISWGWEDAE
jgi:hypothetical protein